MKRRQWLTGTSAFVLGSLSGYLGMLNTEKVSNEDKTASPDGGTTANRTDADGTSFVRHPDGNAEISLALEHTSGFAAPEQYEFTVELSHVELTRAGKAGGVLYNIDETITFRKRPDEIGRNDYTLSRETDEADSPEDKVTLVEQTEIPVTTYEYLRLFGSVIAASTSDDETVRLEGQDSIEWAIGSVYEEGDYKECIGTVGVDEADQGYELSTVSMQTRTW